MKNFIKKIIRKLYSIVFRANKLKKSKESLDITEEQYYEEMFTRNKDWNTVDPNHEETLRWNKIKLIIENLDVNSFIDFNILDLGCGRGWLTNLLNQYGSAQGIEPVSSVVAYGKSLYPHLKLNSGNASEFLEREPQTKFQLIVSSEVIEHIPFEHKSEFAQQISLLLKTNGYVIITTPRAEAQHLYLQHAGADQPIEDWMTEEEVKRVFTSNGFSVVSIDRINCIIPNSNVSTDLYQVWCFKKLESKVL
jgi:2-polyprenyl-3-methyl-5-hydroxy-6-metoxy-1,4-benzoquinol methylase